jgi:endonuclease/exonuclease/phosphatase (EEP) superfamily protein YafD
MKRISWLAAGGLASCAAARLTAADRCRRFEAATVPLLAFTPHAAASALLGSLLLRRKGPATAAALTGAALAAVLAPRAVGRPQPQVGGPVLRVITVNTLKGRASAEAVVGLARHYGADVLFLQELTEPAQAGRADRPAPARGDRSGQRQHQYPRPRPRHLRPVPAGRGARSSSSVDAGPAVRGPRAG